ncbi:hypothetical protein ACA910_000847 [Epithemia clementina (nom. ined.)]
MTVGGANKSSTPHHPFGFSQIGGNPSFRSYALNAVAVIPLLSSNDDKDATTATTATGGGDGVGNDGNEQEHITPESHSVKSFRTLWAALNRHPTSSPISDTVHNSEDELLLVVANSSLTRPGDWRYQDTPLKAFHWQYGCQRLNLFDGRPERSRLAQDRLLNPHLTRDWIDLCPSRRTAAVIGILNIHDCKSQEDFQKAQEELHQWAAQRYATPPYQVTAHGQLGIERDQPVERLYVFDSFDEDCQHIDLSQASSSSSILAFPPSDEAHSQMMDLHLNVVVNDLAVAIFRSLEAGIRHSDDIAKTDVVYSPPTNAPSAGGPARRAISRYMAGGGAAAESNKEIEEERRTEEPNAPTNLSLQNVVGLVSPENKLAQDSANSKGADSGKDPNNPSQDSAYLANNATPKPSTAANLRRLGSNQTTPPQLLTPMDHYVEWSSSSLSFKDTDALKRRDCARREKLAADLSLLAGSPLDAYERYLKAAHLSRANPDPLWYAMSLVGCATAHIAMAEAGGYNVDEYLENNFSLPDDILAVAGIDVATASTKQTFPEVVFALCEEALAILNRHPTLAPFYAGLLFQLALYTAESAESHLRCRWGEGPGSYAGGENPPFRWENAVTVKVSQLKTKDGRDMIDINIMNRTKSICELLQHAVSVPDLDAPTRLDIATQSARLCLEGIPGTRWKKSNTERIQLPRKAAYFAVVAAESMSKMSGGSSNAVLENLWLLACQLYSRKPNGIFGATEEIGSYAWATLRASTLHALALEGTSPACLEASEALLTLLEKIRPTIPASAANMTLPPVQTPVISTTRPTAVDGVSRQEPGKDFVSSADFLPSGDDTYTAASVTKMIRDRYTQVTGGSSLLTEQAKWANDAPKPAVLVPLSSQFPGNLLALPCVWSAIEFDECARAQHECIERIKNQRKVLSTSSAYEVNRFLVGDFSPDEAIPLSVSNKWSLLVHEDYEVSLLKKKLEAVDNGAMATFYNPFEKSRDSRAVVPVAAEEERVIALSLNNSLTVPLTVKECQLCFSGEVGGRINSGPVSFVLAPLAKDFVVRFPFTIISPEQADEGGDESVEFELKEISFSCLNHRFSLPIKKLSGAVGNRIGDIAKPAAYPVQPKAKSKTDKSVSGLLLEALPCQPRLGLCYSGTKNVLKPNTKLTLGVTEGELVSTPKFNLSNDCGAKGQGLLERIQIAVVGVHVGLAEKIIFDSNDRASKTDSVQSERDFLQDVSGESSQLLKVRVVPGTELDLDALNSANSGNTQSRELGFQIAVAKQFREKLNAAETEVTFRIRYAGKSTKSSEVWRKFDIPIVLSHFKGPRVTSVTFRPDLTHCNMLPELLRSFQARVGSGINRADPAFRSNESGPSSRVGLDHSIHVCSESVVSIVSIMNDSKSDIVLSRSDESPVGSFGSSLLSTVLVPRGVKVSILMSIPRLPRESDMESGDFADALLKATDLRWTASSTGSSSDPHRFACGSMSINRQDVSNLITKTPSIIPSIFEPPCKIGLKVQGSDVTMNSSSCSVCIGEPVSLVVNVSIAPWISAEICQRCDFTVELFAVWLDKSTTTAPVPHDHAWCGMVTRKYKMADMKAAHSAKVILLQRGNFALSACVRISQFGKGDEVWWAPLTANISVVPAGQ